MICSYDWDTGHGFEYSDHFAIFCGQMSSILELDASKTHLDNHEIFVYDLSSRDQYNTIFPVVFDVVVYLKRC